MDPYSLKAIADQKIAEDRQAAARYWLAVKADRARREARQPAGSPLAGLLRALAGLFWPGRSVLSTKVPGPGGW